MTMQIPIRKWFLLFFCTLILPNTSFAIDVDYFFSIDDPSKSQASVRMIVSNLLCDSFSISEQFSTAYSKIDILSIVAQDEAGNNLPIDVFTANDRYKWSINTKGLSKCVFEYTIKPTAHSNYWEPSNDNKYYYAYISPDFTIVPAWAFFLLPINQTWIKPDVIRISLNIPKDWQVITPLPLRNGIYYPLDIPSVNWSDVFCNSFFWFGNLDIYQKKIGDSDVTVAFYGDFSASLKQTYVNNTWELYSYFSSVWGGSSEYPYQVLFYPNTVNGDSVIGSTHVLGQSIGVFPESNPMQVNWSDKAHEICETRWINYDWGFFNNSCLWAKSGFAYLYAQKSNAKTRVSSLQFVEGNLFVTDGLKQYYS